MENGGMCYILCVILMEKWLKDLMVWLYFYFIGKCER
jgi:hypothetical protein